MRRILTNPARLCVCLLLSSIIGTETFAQTSLPYISDEAETFKEGAFVWPAPPDYKKVGTTWQTYEVPQPSSGTYQIDLNSLTIGSDEVIRMVLMQTSNTGVRNISFEGFRCKTNERKIYGFLRNDGTWNEFANPSWQAVKNFASAKHITTLSKNFLCDGPTSWGVLSEIKKRLASGGEKITGL